MTETHAQRAERAIHKPGCARMIALSAPATARRVAVAVLAAMAAVVLAACGSDRDPQTVAGTDLTDTAAQSEQGGPAASGGDGGSDTSVACDAFVAVDRAINIDEDLEAGVAALQDFVSAAPDHVAAAVAPAIPLLREDPEAAFESEEIAIAAAAADDYAFDHCGDTQLDVKAYDFAFSGMPAEVAAGRVAFRLSNHTQASEFHEALLLRKADSGAATPHDLLAAGLGTPVSVETTLAAFPPFEFLGVGFVEPEGSTADVFVVDLEPGQYVIACLLPVNSPALIWPYFEGEEVEGDRHFDHGMYAEFTVK